VVHRQYRLSFAFASRVRAADGLDARVSVNGANILGVGADTVCLLLKYLTQSTYNYKSIHASIKTLV